MEMIVDKFGKNRTVKFKSKSVLHNVPHLQKKFKIRAIAIGSSDDDLDDNKDSSESNSGSDDSVVIMEQSRKRKNREDDKKLSSPHKKRKMNTRSNKFSFIITKPWLFIIITLFINNIIYYIYIFLFII